MDAWQAYQHGGGGNAGDSVMDSTAVAWAVEPSPAAGAHEGPWDPADTQAAGVPPPVSGGRNKRRGLPPTGMSRSVQLAQVATMQVGAFSDGLAHGGTQRMRPPTPRTGKSVSGNVAGAVRRPSVASACSLVGEVMCVCSNPTLSTF
jgi:hypothetical protein